MKNFFTSKIFLLILVFVFLFVILAFTRAYFRDYEIREEIKKMEKTVVELKEKNIELINMRDYVSGDEYVEDQARLELNMVAEGENVVFLEKAVVEKEKQEFEYLENSDENISIANYKKWWYYIIKHNL